MFKGVNDKNNQKIRSAIVSDPNSDVFIHHRHLNYYTQLLQQSLLSANKLLSGLPNAAVSSLAIIHWIN